MNELFPSSPAPGGEFLFYQAEDGRTRLQVRVQDETVWLSLNQMADLFQRDKSVISRHINNVFGEGELLRERVVANYATTAADGKTYQVEFFNLDVIISVDWIAKLDDFLRLGGRDILTHAGRISHEQEVLKAELEFERFHRAQLAQPSQVEKDFDAAVREMKNLPAPSRKPKKS